MTKSDFALPLLEWINIPEGTVTLEKGMGKEHIPPTYTLYSTDSIGTFDVAPFAIAKYPVTNEQFQAFVEDNGYGDNHWWQGIDEHPTLARSSVWKNPTYPRETVSWYEAIAFSRWLADKTELPVTLPTEIQWQWAAVGDTGWAYPYGPEFDKRLCNTQESHIDRTIHVNYHDNKLMGKTEFGVMDMCGNLREWCLDVYFNPDHPGMSDGSWRHIRGGAWNYPGELWRATSRYGWKAEWAKWEVGFRVSCSSPVSEHS